MDAGIISAQSTQSYSFSGSYNQQGQLQQLSISASQTDTVQFGNTTITQSESLNIILERSYDKLTSLVVEAKDVLGIAPDAQLDTSPEATANRIAYFALNFFEQYAAKHDDLQGKEARKAFADLIGGAINQGIQEAQDILGALGAITGEIENSITTIQTIIQERLDAFINQTD
jgi:hypothetical protein